MRSPERARELGEVFTNEPEVNAMLDLLQDVNYASRYLEPGCGSGNFLVEIFKRKFQLMLALPEVKTSLKLKSLNEFQLKLLIVLGSIYGIDISDINISEARERLRDLAIEQYKSATKTLPDESLLAGINFVIDNNIILGDMLNSADEIEIYEYAELPSQKLKIRVFQYSDLLYPEDEVFEDLPLLFGHVPQAIREFPAIPYEEVGDLEI
jgi:SAM-dependent methyltransferase